VESPCRRGDELEAGRGNPRDGCRRLLVRRPDHIPRYQIVGFFALRGIYQPRDTRP